MLSLSLTNGHTDRHTHTHRQDRFYTLDRWCRREQSCVVQNAQPLDQLHFDHHHSIISHHIWADSTNYLLFMWFIVWFYWNEGVPKLIFDASIKRTCVKCVLLQCHSIDFMGFLTVSDISWNNSRKVKVIIFIWPPKNICVLPWPLKVNI